MAAILHGQHLVALMHTSDVRSGAMYDGRELLWRIDHHTAPILIGFGLAMVFQTLLMVSAVRGAARDPHISIPLFCTFFWFAHHLRRGVPLHTWFPTHDHLVLKCFLG